MAGLFLTEKFYRVIIKLCNTLNPLFRLLHQVFAGLVWYWLTGDFILIIQSLLNTLLQVVQNSL